MRQNTVRSLGAAPACLPTMGDASKTYNITIPDQMVKSIYTSYACSRVLLSAPIYFRNVTCSVNHKTICNNIEDSDFITNSGKKEALAGGFFMVNDHVFHLTNYDRPIKAWEQWVPAYSSFCTAFFVSALRTSTSFIFDDCGVPVYPLPAHSDPVLPLYELELYGRSLRLTKDISVFFHGRNNVRTARKAAAKHIRKYVPNTYIGFTDRGEFLSSEEYINKMSRAKIAWCPRSVWSKPDKECNAPPAKETEAMCLGTMVVKHPIGITEVEKREPGVHFVEIKNDDSDVVEKIQYYLEHDDEREEIAHNGRMYFERNCSVSSRMNFMLKKCLEAMGEA